MQSDRKLGFWITVAAITILGGVGFLYSGLYPIGADVPHNKITFRILETLREASIARAAKDIAVPDLDDPRMLLAGGADYNEMCTQCHLKPGVDKSDMSVGLYPSPPNLTRTPEAHGHDHGGETDAARARRLFWIIKHGVKASGMPAWGKTHDDDRIWAMVAFLKRLPALTPAQYQIITARKNGASMHH